MYIQSQPLGGRGKSFQGERFYTADNPPYGATVTWYLKEAIKTKKEKRQESEREAGRKGAPVGWPTRADLRAEEEEEAPAIIVTITDASDNVVRRLTGPVGAGIQRVTWDLRYPAANLSAPPPPDADFDFEPPSGPLVMPGTYKATVSKRVDGVVTQLGPPQQFQIVGRGAGKHVDCRPHRARGIPDEGRASTACSNAVRPKRPTSSGRDWRQSNEQSTKRRHCRSACRMRRLRWIDARTKSCVR